MGRESRDLLLPTTRNFRALLVAPAHSIRPCAVAAGRRATGATIHSPCRTGAHHDRPASTSARRQNARAEFRRAPHLGRSAPHRRGARQEAGYRLSRTPDCSSTSALPRWVARPHARAQCMRPSILLPAEAAVEMANQSSVVLPAKKRDRPRILVRCWQEPRAIVMGISIVRLSPVPLGQSNPTLRGLRDSLIMWP